MHKATCTDCGRACEVPFRPTGSKPVLCSDCFKGSDSRSSGRQDRGRDFSRPRFDDKRMYEAVCDKCHKTCEVPFRPTGEKPVFCSECFTKGDSNGGGKGNDQLAKQIEAINIKLDRILKALARTSPDLDFKIDDTEKPVSKSKKGGVIVVASKVGKKAQAEEIIEPEVKEIKEKKDKKVKKEKTAKKAVKKSAKKAEKKNKK
ncbi:hypothetical protein KJ673_00240 [Patescibacteria group bacterium]|nr:hypothetical protein [Patescibacteria group bacterium]MBU4452954.1 hypothetical protein [Patescibacteria group bacterium]